MKVQIPLCHFEYAYFQLLESNEDLVTYHVTQRHCLITSEILHKRVVVCGEQRSTVHSGQMFQYGIGDGSTIVRWGASAYKQIRINIRMQKWILCF